METAWRRIKCFLPIGTPSERFAARTIEAITKVHFPNFTTAISEDRSVFIGHYQREDNGDWDLDRIGFIFVDTPLEAAIVDKYIIYFRRIITAEYALKNSPQESVWVTVEPILNNPSEKP